MGHFPKGLETQRRGLGTPEPRHQTHPAPRPPPGPIQEPQIIQGRKKGRALLAPSYLWRPHTTKPLGPCYPHQRPQLGMPLRSPHSPRLRPAGLLGANPNPGQPRRGPSQGAWRHNPGDGGPPSPSARLTLLPGRHPGPSGHRQSFRAGEQEGPPSPQRT